jgi:hypothetical protein
MLEVTNILDILQPEQLIDISCIFVLIDKRLAICITAEKGRILDLFPLNRNEQKCHTAGLKWLGKIIYSIYCSDTFLQN